MAEGSGSASRVVSSVPLPPTPTLAEMQSRGRATAPAQPRKRMMSLNSSILAAQRDWEQKQQDSGQIEELDDSSDDSDSPTESDDIDMSEGVDNMDVDASDIEGQNSKGDLASSASPSRSASKRVFDESPEVLAVQHDLFHKRVISLSSTSESESGRLEKSSELLEQTRRGGGAELAARLSPRASAETRDLTSTSKLQEDIVYTEYESIAKPKDSRQTYFTFPGRDATALGERPRGTIVPTGYSFQRNHPQRLFQCPVRGCPSAFNNAASLGGHFCSSHKNCAFNDNCDGTISRVGRFAKITGSPSAAIVASQIPINLNMAMATVADRLALDQGARHRRSKIQPSATTKPNTRVGNVIDFTFRNGMTLKSQALSYLLAFYGGSNSYGGNTIHELSCYDKCRDFPVEWIEYHRNREFDEKLFAISLAYLVGDQSDEPSRSCRQRELRRTCRLSDICVGLPASLSPTSRASFTNASACVGCQYWSYVQRQECPCDWLRRGWSDEECVIYPERTLQASTSFASVASEAVDERILDGHSPLFTQSSSETRRSSRIKHHISYTEVPPEVLAADEPMQSMEVPKPLPAQISQWAAPPTPAGNDGNGGDNQFMETWEKAPGRIIDKKHGENIAFSNAYLNGREPVPVSQDIHFNVMVIKPGDRARWVAEHSQIRTCSVASGKLKVKLCDETFHIGPNGLFVVRPGQECFAENELYTDSIVHCTTIKDYELTG